MPDVDSPKVTVWDTVINEARMFCERQEFVPTHENLLLAANILILLDINAKLDNG